MFIHGSLRRYGSGMTIFALGLLFAGGLSDSPAQGQQEIQEIHVTIENYEFRTSQMPLQLQSDTFIYIQNRDNVRHDFSSDMFINTLTHMEHEGVVAYGKGMEGVYIDPGREAMIHFVISKPGRFEFQCSIHKDMKGEILLLTVDAV